MRNVHPHDSRVRWQKAMGVTIQPVETAFLYQQGVITLCNVTDVVKV